MDRLVCLRMVGKTAVVFQHIRDNFFFLGCHIKVVDLIFRLIVHDQVLKICVGQNALFDQDLSQKKIVRFLHL